MNSFAITKQILSNKQINTNVSCSPQPTDSITLEGMENSSKNSTEPRWTTYQYFEYSFNFVLITLYFLCFLGNLLTLTAGVVLVLLKF